MVVYVNTQGASIFRDGRRLLVKANGEEPRPLLLHQLEQLVLCGNVNLTQPAISLLLSRNIDTVFLRANGTYLGRLVGSGPKNVELRQRQFTLCADAEARLPLARQIAWGKLKNMATVADRIARARGSEPARKAARELRSLAAQVQKAPDLARARGLEGRAGAVYFPTLEQGLTRKFGFRKRTRRPPLDPVNAVLSLLYTFLTSRTHSAVCLAGLDPQPGIFHELRYGRFSLPLDLMEEFRPVIADTLTLSLFNKAVLHETDFEWIGQERKDSQEFDGSIAAAAEDPLGMIFSSEEGDPAPDPVGNREDAEPEQDAEEPGSDPAPVIRLRPPAFRRVLQAFEQKMQSKFHHPHNGKTMTFSESLLFQARLLRRTIEGTEEKYVPLLLR